MKARVFVFLCVLLFCLTSCGSIEKYTGLYLINKSTDTQTFQISLSWMSLMSTDVKPSEKWHYNSIWYEDHYITVLSDDPKEIKVFVPKYDARKAAFVEWDGHKFTSYLR